MLVLTKWVRYHVPRSIFFKKNYKIRNCQFFSILKPILIMAENRHLRKNRFRSQPMSKSQSRWALVFIHVCEGLSTRIRFPVRIAIRFRARFAYKWSRVLIILRRPITNACKHISRTIGRKFNCKPFCAGNRTQNRTAIRTQNRLCRRPLSK
jgi:hypothetical protein